jgi:hypothetical protein
MWGIGERKRGDAEWSRRPSRSFLLLGAINNYPAVRSRTIRFNQLTAREDGAPPCAAELERRAVATAVPVRSLGAKPDGKKRCKIAGKGCDWRARNGLRTPDGRTWKNRHLPLGAGPRAAVPRPRTPYRASRRGSPERPLPAGARRDETGTAGSELGAFADRCWFADTVGWHAGGASDERRRGTPGYSIWLGDGWDGSPSRIP